MKNAYKVNEEAVKKIAERVYDNGSTVINRNDLEEMFPELKESEDERIRKYMIKYFEANKDELSKGFRWNGITVEECIAWLEKKPDTNCLLSWSETDEKMLQSLEGIVKDYWAKAEQEKNEIKIREASNVSYFLKTIQKSPLCWIKCSDGLPNRDGIYLVVTDGRHNDVYDMARYDSIEGWHKASEIIYWMPIPQLNNKSIIEQKPVEWSEEDENYKDALIGLINEIKSQPLKRLEDWDSYLNWIKSLKDRIQPERKWSAEDSRILYNVKAYIGYAAGQRGVRDELFKEANEWLNSLPIGFIYNKNYNEDMVTLLVGELKQIASDNNAPEQYQVEINWLKSLRPQKQWKPSDEQMERLKGTINSLPHQEVLYSLYQDLNKLREK